MNDFLTYLSPLCILVIFMICFCRFVLKGCLSADDTASEYDNEEMQQNRHFFRGMRDDWRTQHVFSLSNGFSQNLAHLRAQIYPNENILPPKYEDAIKIQSNEPPPLYSHNTTVESPPTDPPSYHSSLASSARTNTGTMPNYSNAITHDQVVTVEQFPSQLQIVVSPSTTRIRSAIHQQLTQINEEGPVDLPGTVNSNNSHIFSNQVSTIVRPHTMMNRLSNPTRQLNHPSNTSEVSNLSRATESRRVSTKTLNHTGGKIQVLTVDALA
uniref:Secreted protein n=1 Tax=Rhabditophanes sp. KR3021 TaxID=114890 RepID=A0AC35UA62_9BILA